MVLGSKGFLTIGWFRIFTFKNIFFIFQRNAPTAVADSGGPRNQTDRAFVSQESPVRPMSILQKVWVLQGKSVQGKVMAKPPNAHRIHENGIFTFKFTIKINQM